MSGAQVAKSEATRERILEAALLLFAQKGYANATMREIADLSGCSLGLAYRYYRSKDSMVLALYERLSDEFAAAAAQLEPGPLAKRWGQSTRADFTRLTPHRMALMGLTSAGLSPGSPTQVLGPESRPIRMKVLAVFELLVVGAQDMPRSMEGKDLAALLYGIHLLLVLFWLQDPTPGQRATASLITLFEEFLGTLRFALRIPGLRNTVYRLSDILRPVLEGNDPDHAIETTAMVSSQA